MNARNLFFIALAAFAIDAIACTSAIVSGSMTTNGRPLLWKNRDTNDQNNRIKRIPAKKGCYEFVGLFDARDKQDTAVWMGYNEKGFAIMNTASYNINKDDVKEKDMDKEGVVMRKALEKCATVDEFEQLLKAWPQPRGVEANFGVIDAQGNGAYFETGNFTLVKYDLKDAPDGVLIRTNYSYSGRVDEGAGYVREANEKKLLAPHILRHDFTPAVFTEEVSRTFYHSVLNKDFTNGGAKWVVDQDFIPRRISTATCVVEGVVEGENPLLTTMWTGLGYPPCAEIFPVWLWEGGVPECLVGTGANNHAPQCDKVNAREKEVFSIKRGNGQHYVNIQKLYNKKGTGYCQVLIPQNMDTYRKGYEEIAKRREQLKKK
ncbi:MAG: carcinine hydrolase/isopenicillin-N N-acyltransferase family protein [Bacteroidales bacterium]|nr:carcinine hydrolase/isopenicillin-N N-acyltransferase family protein [Bacteroidales bacterium]